MNNPTRKYDIDPFCLFWQAQPEWVLKSEGDISAGLFMGYFIKLKEFATKQHRMANSVHF